MAIVLSLSLVSRHTWNCDYLQSLRHKFAGAVALSKKEHLTKTNVRTAKGESENREELTRGMRVSMQLKLQYSSS